MRFCVVAFLCRLSAAVFVAAVVAAPLDAGLSGAGAVGQKNLYPRMRSVTSAMPPSSTIRLTDDGTDWGARINAADKQLGSGAGVIEVLGGGRIATQVEISPYHTLRFGRGTWTNSNSANETFLLKDNTVLEGAGWDTIIQEAPGNTDQSYFIVKPYRTARVDAGAQVRNITVRNLQFSGQGILKSRNVAQSTVNTGLLEGGLFENIWFNRTHAIGLDIGETNLQGTSFAGNLVVRGCRFTNVGGGVPPDYRGGGGVGLAITNGRGVTVTNNVFIDAFGNADLDIEPNAASDTISDITIAHNAFVHDNQTGAGENYVYGVAVHTGSARYGPITIRGNTFRGTYYRDLGVPGWYPDGRLLTAIYVNYGGNGRAHHVTVIDNDIKFTGGVPIILDGADYSTVRNNHIFMPNHSILVVGSHNLIEGNYVATGASQGTYYFGIEERGSSDYNVFSNNRTTRPVTVVGPHSVSQGNVVTPRPEFRQTY